MPVWGYCRRQQPSSMRLDAVVLQSASASLSASVLLLSLMLLFVTYTGMYMSQYITIEKISTRFVGQPLAPANGSLAQVC